MYLARPANVRVELYPDRWVMRDVQQGCSAWFWQRLAPNATAPARAPCLLAPSLPRPKKSNRTPMAFLLCAYCRSSVAVAGSSLFDSCQPPLCACSSLQDLRPLANRPGPYRAWEGVIHHARSMQKAVWNYSQILCAAFASLPWRCLRALRHRRARPLSLLAALTVIDDAPDPSHTYSGTSLDIHHAQFGLLSFARINPSRGPLQLASNCLPPSTSSPCASALLLHGAVMPVVAVTTSPCNFTVHVCNCLSRLLVDMFLFNSI